MHGRSLRPVKCNRSSVYLTANWQLQKYEFFLHEIRNIWGGVVSKGQNRVLIELRPANAQTSRKKRLKIQFLPHLTEREANIYKKDRNRKSPPPPLAFTAIGGLIFKNTRLCVWFWMFCTRPTNFLTFFLFFLSLFVFNLNDRNHGGVGSMWHYTDTAKSQNENLFENISKQLDCTARVRPPASTTKHLRTTQRYKKCLVKPSYSNLPLPANDYNRVSLTSWATKREFLLFRYCRNKSRLSVCGKGLSVRNTWKLSGNWTPLTMTSRDSTAKIEFLQRGNCNHWFQISKGEGSNGCVKTP